ncbi:MAG: hypothetical protein CFE38_13460 [Comamonadaceae bacterium PBBC1]|nr:MAG: hypothetical protein CFE38_13460 [Comamonadaceae bacterium PBBC1]
MKFFSSLVLAASLVLTGCASVDMASQADNAKSKEFNAPSQGMAGVYIYRDSVMGKALKRDIWLNGQCVGASAPDVFFYTEAAGGQTHKIETESEFSPNTLELVVEAGKNYFIRQFIKMGVLSGGSDLEKMPEDQGQKAVAKLNMAKPGQCKTTR